MRQFLLVLSKVLFRKVVPKEKISRKPMHHQSCMLILGAGQEWGVGQEYQVRNIPYAGSVHSSKFPFYKSPRTGKRTKQQPPSFVN